MKALGRLTIAWKLVLVAGLAIGLLLIAAAAAVSSHTSGIVAGLSHRYAEAVIDDAVQQVQAEVASTQAAAQAMQASIAAAHEAGLVDRDKFVAMVRPNAVASSTVMGAWFMAEPDALDGKDIEHLNDAVLASNKDGRFSVYWVNNNGNPALELEADGSDFAEAYYTGPAVSGRATLVEPYFETIAGAKVAMTSVAIPVRSSGRQIGVAGLDMSLTNLSSRLGALKPLGGGRVMLLSSKGVWVAHPDSALRMTAMPTPAPTR
ncbi:hypothetical protein [Caulobacter sp. B11]|uniref:PDC sensor domain-containing protein n=1 Tax=Caulobacter sp. B11 TaxID=2048899 RepID=UPI0011809A1F|nr:hypothetical protein [Caulobacter sp. B11]